MLLDKNGVVKLCDFGSVVNEIIDLRKLQIDEKILVQRNYNKFTTPLYRPPELVEISKHSTLCQALDIWVIL